MKKKKSTDGVPKILRFKKRNPYKKVDGENQEFTKIFGIEDEDGNQINLSDLELKLVFAVEHYSAAEPLEYLPAAKALGADFFFSNMTKCEYMGGDDYKSTHIINLYTKKKVAKK
jgi:hypothetical protein